VKDNDWIFSEKCKLCNKRFTSQLFAIPMVIVTSSREQNKQSD